MPSNGPATRNIEISYSHVFYKYLKIYEEKEKLQHNMCQMPVVVKDAQKAQCKAGQLGD